MKRFLLIAVLLMLCFPAFASVGIQDDGTEVGQATNLNIKGETTATFDGSTKEIDLTTPTSITTAGNVTFKTSLLSLGRVADSSSIGSSSTPTGLSNLPYATIVKVSGPTATSFTLPAGVSGQIVSIRQHGTMGGTWTVTNNSSSGNFTSFSMDANQEMVLLYYDGTAWNVLNFQGATITWKNPNP